MDPDQLASGPAYLEQHCFFKNFEKVMSTKHLGSIWQFSYFTSSRGAIGYFSPKILAMNNRNSFVCSDTRKLTILYGPLI